MEAKDEHLHRDHPDGEPLGPFSSIKSDNWQLDPNVTCNLKNGGTRPAGYRYCWKGKIMQCGSDGKWIDTDIAC